MSESNFTALLVAIPAILLSLGTLITSIVTLVRSRDIGRKADAIIGKTEAIHETTNGTLHKVESSNRELTERVNGLQRQLAAALLSGDRAAAVAEQAATDVRLAATPVTETE